MKMKRQRLYAYLTGIVDAEGCFSVSLKRQNDTRFGWVIDPIFHVTQHKSARDILAALQESLGCGRIIQKPGQDNLLMFVVENRRQLREKILPFFRRHKLWIKAKDFQEFSEIVEALERRDHWNEAGFRRLAERALGFRHAKGHRKYTMSDIVCKDA